jgi:Fur family ferric uptake transcriptional regulator
LQLQKFANAETTMSKRLTSARTIILETICTEHKHWTVQEVYQAVKSQLPSLNLSTVYRALDYLSSEGWISASDLGAGTPVYEVIQDVPHHHLVCRECGHVFEIPHKEVYDFFARISRDNEFEVITKHLILFGTCEACQE